MQVDDDTRRRAANAVARLYHRVFTPYSILPSAADYYDSLRLSRLASMSQPDLMRYLSAPAAFQAAAGFLYRLTRLACAHYNRPLPPTEPSAVHKFLASFTLVLHSVKVVRVPMQHAEQTIMSANKVVHAVDRISEHFHAGASFDSLPPGLVERLPRIFTFYFHSYNVYLDRDRERVNNELLTNLDMLGYALTRVDSSEIPEHVKMAEDCRRQIENLRAIFLRVNPLDGQEKLDAYDENRARGAGATDTEALQAIYASGINPIVPLCSAPSPMQMVYCHLVDENFKLDDSGCSVYDVKSDHAKLVRAARENYWRVAKVELESSPPVYLQVLKLFFEVKSSLQRHVLMNFDFHAIREACTKGMPLQDMLVHLRTLHDTVLIVHNSERRAQVHLWWAEVYDENAAPTPDLIVDISKMIVRSVLAYRIDTFNVRMSVLSQILEAHGVNYMQSKIRLAKADGSFSYQPSRPWVLEQYRAQGSPSPLDVPLFVKKLMLRFVAAKPNFEAIPSVLKFDSIFLKNIRADLDAVVFGAVAWSILSSTRVFHLSDESRLALKGFIMDGSVPASDDYEPFLSTLPDFAPPACLTPAQFVARYSKQDDPVFALIKDRVDVWVCKEAMNQPVDPELLSEPLRHVAFSVKVSEVARLFQRLAQVNADVHGEAYVAMINGGDP